MNDTEAENLIRDAMEYWARNIERPKELVDLIATIPEEQKNRIWKRMCDEASR